MGTFDIGATAANVAEGAIGQVLGLALGGIQNKRQIKQQRKLNQLQVQSQKELADYQQQQQLEMWKATNYPAQIEQMKQAGLNPALQYGMGGGGGTTAGTGIQTGVTGGSAQGATNEGMGLLMAQMKLIDAQTKKTEAEAKAIDPNIKLTEAQTQETVQKTLNLKLEALNTEAKTYLTKAQEAQQNLQNYITTKTQENIIQRIETETKTALTNLKKLDIETEIQEKSKEDQIKIFHQNSITAGLNNIAIRNNIELTQQQIENLKQTALQGWEQLKQGNTKNAIETIKTKFITEHPTLLQTAGKEIETFLNNIYDIVGKKR